MRGCREPSRASETHRFKEPRHPCRDSLNSLDGAGTPPAQLLVRLTHIGHLAGAFGVLDRNDPNPTASEVGKGHYDHAIKKIDKVLVRVDGLDGKREKKDWMIDGQAKDHVRSELELIKSLLELL